MLGIRGRLHLKYHLTVTEFVTVDTLWSSPCQTLVVTGCFPLIHFLTPQVRCYELNGDQRGAAVHRNTTQRLESVYGRLMQ